MDSRSKPVVLRTAAAEDIDSALEHYLTEAGSDTALRFIDALERALTHVGRRPATGSPRHGVELDIPGLRAKQLQRFPWLVFHIALDDHVAVLRVLHARHDIPTTLQGFPD